VIVGRHRKPEAAVVPYRLLTRLLEVYERDRVPQAAADLMAERADSTSQDFAPLVDTPELTAHRQDLDALAADDPQYGAVDEATGRRGQLGR
jgi:hypothetical protein